MPKRKKQDEQEEIRGAAPQMSGDTAAAPRADRDAVARRAYELYLARGGGEGSDMDDWLRAEQELSKDRGTGGTS